AKDSRDAEGRSAAREAGEPRGERAERRRAGRDLTADRARWRERDRSGAPVDREIWFVRRIEPLHGKGAAGNQGDRSRQGDAARGGIRPRSTPRARKILAAQD